MRRTRKAVRELALSLNYRLGQHGAGYLVRVDSAYGKLRIMREVDGMPQINLWLTNRIPAGEAYVFLEGMHSMLDMVSDLMMDPDTRCDWCKEEGIKNCRHEGM